MKNNVMGSRHTTRNSLYRMAVNPRNGRVMATPTDSTSSKLQHPSSREGPNSKHQASSSREAPSSKLQTIASRVRLGVWDSGFYWSLGFGIWDFSGAWMLVLEASSSLVLGASS